MPDSDATAEAVGHRTHPLTGAMLGLLWAGAVIAGLTGHQLFSDSWDDGLPPVLVIIGAIAGGLALGQLAGFLSWWFTRYVIDPTELRITSGVLTKNSRRIAFERIQSVDIAEPLLARLFGLAELRIETAGGGESGARLRFVRLTDAQALRRLLLARAQGQDVESLEELPRDVVAAVPPERIMIGTVLSLDFAIAALGFLAVLVATLWFGQAVAFLGGLVAAGYGLAQIVVRRVIAQWGFVITRGERGLRIERGLLSRTSQTIPAGRVQGIAVVEPWLWKRFGWRRLEVDVAGYAHSSSSGESDSDAHSTLLPIADPALADHVIDDLIPGATAEAGHRVGASPRSRVFAPIGWRYRWVGWDDVAFVARTGWITRRTNVVPHAKTQSVELRQGPWQRRRGVATVEVHTPDGPVDADGRHLAAHDAREVALAQVTRARAARN